MLNTLMMDSEEDLAQLRSRIDDIDDEIFALIARRFSVVAEVAELKRRFDDGKSFVRPGREARLLRKAASFSDEPLRKIAAAVFMRGLIAASCNAEAQLRISYPGVADGISPYYWLAREYFGQFSQFARQLSPAKVIAEISGKANAIGVVPYPPEPDESWWAMLASQRGEKPKVFSLLPGLEYGRHDAAMPSALALAMIDPEPSDDDRTMVALMAGRDSSRARMAEGMRKAGMEARMIASSGESGRGDSAWLLFEVDGFITSESRELQELRVTLGTSLMAVSVLGAYSVPLRVVA